MRGTYGFFVGVSAAAFIAAGVISVADVLPRHAASADAAPAAAEGGAWTPAESVKPPVAAKKDHTVTTKFGASRNDPYYWLNEKENPEVIAYLEA